MLADWQHDRDAEWMTGYAPDTQVADRTEDQEALSLDTTYYPESMAGYDYQVPSNEDWNETQMDPDSDKDYEAYEDTEPYAEDPDAHARAAFPDHSTFGHGQLPEQDKAPVCKASMEIWACREPPEGMRGRGYGDLLEARYMIVTPQLFFSSLMLVAKPQLAQTSSSPNPK